MSIFRNIIFLLLACLIGSSQLVANDVPDFRNEVLPALTKAGCNSAACHGAAIGRGGFRLSLLGYDPETDFQSIAYEYRGRRLNLAEPEKSLALLKPSRRIAHKGGMRLPPSSDAYRIVSDWIAAGAPLNDSARLNRLEISPSNHVAQQVGEEVQVTVMAHFDDGTSRDVTQWAVYEPDDRETVRCSDEGLIRSQRRGQVRVLVRFLDIVRCVTITTPVADESIEIGQRLNSSEMDRWINRKLDELRLTSSPRTTDAAYARRVYLDLIGTLPTADEVREFVAAKDPSKRDQLVNDLMTRKEFVDHWTYRWGDLLRIESGRLGENGAAAYHRWMRRQVAENTPLDEIARELISTIGNSNQVGAANFHRVPNDPLQEAEYVSRVFLGVRLQCANCHNHRLDRWTQDDYHGLAAIFANIDRRPVVKLMNRGDTIHPKTKLPAIPKIPGEDYLSTASDLREPLLDWLTSKENPYFAKSAVNRIWKDLMGRGLVEPVDDLRASNPATHPELLELLTKDFIDDEFNIRNLIRRIVSSEAYQRSSLPVGNNQTDEMFYSRAIVRPLSPVVMADAVSDVTRVREKFVGQSNVQDAIALGDSRVRSQTLDLLGRCSREAACDVTADNQSAALPLTLHVINGGWLNTKLEAPNGRLATLIKSGKSNVEILDEIYWTAFGRGLTNAESDYWNDRLESDDQETRTTLLRDAFWAVLNSTEFRCNH